MFGILDLADEAGDDVDARFHREFLGLDLVAHRGDGVHRRADESDAFRFQRFDEARAFGQEAIARMHRFGPGLLGRGNDLVRHQIAFRSGCGADMHRLVRHANEGRARIGIGIDRHGRDTHALGRLDDAAGDFATIGDEDFREHRCQFSVPGFASPDI